MTKDLDVLVIESHPHVASEAIRHLEAEGHRVHRCYEEPDKGFPCRGLASPPDCPIDTSVDVALVVRAGYAPAPSHFEEGVSCAVRAHVPIVERGPEQVDPFRPWITVRVPPDGDVSDACTQAVAESYAPIRRAVQARIGRLLHTQAIDPEAVSVRFEADRGALDVHLDLPVVVRRSVEQALAVRVLDALRGTGRTFGRVDVHVHSG